MRFRPAAAATDPVFNFHCEARYNTRFPVEYAPHRLQYSMPRMYPKLCVLWIALPAQIIWDPLAILRGMSGLDSCIRPQICGPGHCPCSTTSDHLPLCHDWPQLMQVWYFPHATTSCPHWAMRASIELGSTTVRLPSFLYLMLKFFTMAIRRFCTYCGCSIDPAIEIRF